MAMSGTRKTVLIITGVLAALVLVALIGLAVIVSSFRKGAPTIHDNSVLALRVGGALGWDTRPNFAGADVQAGGVGMHDLQVLEGLDLLGGTALASHANSPLDEG